MYIDRQVICQYIIHLFPVVGVPPRIYFLWQGFPPGRKRFFFGLLTFLRWWRNGWRPRRQTTGGRGWEHCIKCPNKGSRALQINISQTSDVFEDHRVGMHQVLNIGTGRRSRKHVWKLLWRSTTWSHLHRVKDKLWGRKWPYRWNSGGILVT